MPDFEWVLSIKDVVLAIQYKVYLVKRVISLDDTVQYSYGHLLTYDSKGLFSPNKKWLQLAY